MRFQFTLSSLPRRPLLPHGVDTILLCRFQPGSDIVHANAPIPLDVKVINDDSKFCLVYFYLAFPSLKTPYTSERLLIRLALCGHCGPNPSSILGSLSKGSSPQRKQA